MVDTKKVKDLSYKMGPTNLNEYGSISDINFDEKTSALSFKINYRDESTLDPRDPVGHDLRASIFLALGEERDVKFKYNTVTLKGCDMYKLKRLNNVVRFERVGPEASLCIEAYKMTLEWKDEPIEDPKDDEE